MYNTKCYLDKMLLYEMLPRQNVTIRKCTIQNVSDPYNLSLKYLGCRPSGSIGIGIGNLSLLQGLNSFLIKKNQIFKNFFLPGIP